MTGATALLSAASKRTIATWSTSYTEETLTFTRSGYATTQPVPTAAAAGHIRCELRLMLSYILCSSGCLQEFVHKYPLSKVMWNPEKAAGARDLLATSGDHLRLWRMTDDAMHTDTGSKAHSSSAESTERCGVAVRVRWYLIHMLQLLYSVTVALDL